MGKEMLCTFRIDPLVTAIELTHKVSGGWCQSKGSEVPRRISGDLHEWRECLHRWRSSGRTQPTNGLYANAVTNEAHRDESTPASPSAWSEPSGLMELIAPLKRHRDKPGIAYALTGCGPSPSNTPWFSSTCCTLNVIGIRLVRTHRRKGGHRDEVDQSEFAKGSTPHLQCHLNLCPTSCHPTATSIPTASTPHPPTHRQSRSRSAPPTNSW